MDPDYLGLTSVQPLPMLPKSRWEHCRGPGLCPWSVPGQGWNRGTIDNVYVNGKTKEAQL